MFRCQQCGKVSQSGEECHKQVIEKREKIYPFREKVFSFCVERKREFRDDKGGTGWEIIKEINVCNECYGVENERILG